MQMTREKPLTWWWMLPVLLLAAGLAAQGLNQDALWYDEWWTVYTAGAAQYGPLSPVAILQRIAEEDPVSPGPLYILLVAGWGALTGWHHAALRVLSLLCGLLTVAWTYRLGRDLASPLVGLAAGAVLASSAVFADYLHELRAYSLLTLLVVVAVWAYWRLAAGKWSVWTAAALAASVTATLYTHYLGGLLIAALAGYHLLAGRQRANWWRITLLLALAGLLFLPWLPVPLLAATMTRVDADRMMRVLSPAAVAQTLIHAFSGGSAALLALFGGPGLVVSLRENGLRLAAALAGGTLALALIANHYLSFIIHIRYLLLLWPLLALVVGAGIVRASRGGLPVWWALAVWIAAGSASALNPAFIAALPGEEPAVPWPALGGALAVLVQQAGPDDAVVFHVETPGREWLNEAVLDYYLHPLGLRHTQFERIPGLLADDDYYRQAQQFIGDAPFVWLAAMPDVPASYHLGEFRRALAAAYVPCGPAADLPGMQLELYARLPHPEPDAVYGGRIGAHILAPPLVTADALALRLGWSAAQSEPVEKHTLSAALHLRTAAGDLIRQADYTLPDGITGCHLTTMPLSDLSAGVYDLHLIVYDWASGERLAGAAAGTQASGDSLPLLRFTRP